MTVPFLVIKKIITIISIPRVGAFLFFFLTRALSVYLIRFSRGASFCYIKSPYPSLGDFQICAPYDGAISRNVATAARGGREQSWWYIAVATRTGKKFGIFVGFAKVGADPSSSSSGSRRWPPAVRGSVWSSRAAFLIKTVWVDLWAQIRVNVTRDKRPKKRRRRERANNLCVRLWPKGCLRRPLPRHGDVCASANERAFRRAFAPLRSVSTFLLPSSSQYIYIVGDRDDTKDDSSRVRNEKSYTGQENKRWRGSFDNTYRRLSQWQCWKSPPITPFG